MLFRIHARSADGYESAALDADGFQLSAVFGRLLPSRTSPRRPRPLGLRPPVAAVRRLAQRKGRYDILALVGSETLRGKEYFVNRLTDWHAIIDEKNAEHDLAGCGASVSECGYRSGVVA